MAVNCPQPRTTPAESFVLLSTIKNSHEQAVCSLGVPLVAREWRDPFLARTVDCMKNEEEEEEEEVVSHTSSSKES